MTPRDPSRISEILSRIQLHRPDRHCPACGAVLGDADGGMACPEHGHLTWSQLRDADTGD